MAAQATDEERRAVATWLVDNGGDLAALEVRIDEIWPDLVERASVSPSDDRKTDASSEGRPE
jgi:dephospho-CoA kinase